jgi:nicotinamide mononucleotide transporter
MDTFSTIEVLGAITGLISVWLTVKNKVWCWFWGIVSVLVYSVVFWETRLYADMALQLVFVVMNVYGWYAWLHGTSDNETTQRRHISSISRDEIFASLLALAVMALGLGQFLRRFTNAAVPDVDALLTAFSLVAIWMQARKYRENWLVWLVADVLYVGLFLNRKLWLTAALYLVFCVMAVQGWREWNAAYILNQQSFSKEDALEH